MHTLATSAQVFQHSTDQLIPDQPLSLPVIHFMSGNSYNLENVDITDVQLQAGVPNATRRVDPNMAEEHHRLMHMLTDLQHKSQKHEDFYREMQAAGSVSGFDKVSEYFGLGVFDQPRNRKSSGTPLRGSNRGTNSPIKPSFDALLVQPNERFEKNERRHDSGNVDLDDIKFG